jgi:hypothetical protein
MPPALIRIGVKPEGGGAEVLNIVTDVEADAV